MFIQEFKNEEEDFPIKSVEAVCTSFFQLYPEMENPKVRTSDGDWPLDTRLAFIDYVDSMTRSNLISETLARKALLPSLD